MAPGLRLRLAGFSLVALASLSSACDEGDVASPAAATPSAVASVSGARHGAGGVAGKPVDADWSPARKGCETVEVFAGGERAGTICVEDAAARRLTVVDLSDTWTPRVFAADPETGDAPEYRAKYLALASDPNADLGLYGVSPTLTVLSRRLVDEARHACDTSVDLVAVGALVTTWSAAPDDRSRKAVLEGNTSRPAIAALQSELACSGLLKKSAATGVVSSSTQLALDAFRRRHFVVGAGLDADTLGALALGGDELAFRGLLRGLRERVADAAGLIEDGSASGTHALVADRELDLTRFAPQLDDDVDGAEDLVDQATDTVARALGWTSPDAARASLQARGETGLRALQVAVALDPPPAYHTATMDLRVEVDRGDVVVAAGGAAARKKLGATRRPTFTVYAKDGDRDRALMRWSTTIGGWKKERTEDGEIALKYKESDVGDRVWRQIIAAPAWMPPDSTPETDLVREGKDGEVSLKRDLIQPGYRNAYGLVMLIHEEAAAEGAKNPWIDHGIRTHGSVDYRSIGRGESHGCHRLYNQLALRLSGFLLQHRHHERRGKLRAGYHRTITWAEQTIEVDVPDRGYLYEMVPPVPVRVLEGRVLGKSPKSVSSLVRVDPAAPKQG